MYRVICHVKIKLNKKFVLQNHSIWKKDFDSYSCYVSNLRKMKSCSQREKIIKVSTALENDGELLPLTDSRRNEKMIISFNNDPWWWIRQWWVVFLRHFSVSNFTTDKRSW